MAVSGLVPDGRAIGLHARQEASSYLQTYGSHIPGKVLADRYVHSVNSAGIYVIYWFMLIVRQELELLLACLLTLQSCPPYTRDLLSLSLPHSLTLCSVAGRLHEATISWSERPFGCSTIMTTYDEEFGPAVYLLRPSSMVTRQYAAAIGKHRQGAKTELEKIAFDTITCKDAVKLIANMYVCYTRSCYVSCR